MCSQTRKVIGFPEFSFTCVHAIERRRPVRYVYRSDGDWTFACGDGDHFEVNDWGRAHTFHLLDDDASLSELVGLKPGAQAFRMTVGAPWLRLEL